ncbi:MAG: hypothetical protein WB765_05445 [Acidimicrobiales bacterium]
MAAADLIIGIAREYVREDVLAEPAIIRRSLTLPELVRRGHAVGRRDRLESLAVWLARADLLGKSDEDNVPDPMGGSPSEYSPRPSRLPGWSTSSSPWPGRPSATVSNRREATD